LPSATAPLQLLASLSPSPPITVAAVEPFDRGLRASAGRGAADSVDAPGRAPAVNDHAASPSAPDPATLPVNGADATTSSQDPPAAAAEQETNPSPAEEAAGVPLPSSAAASDIAAVEGPADPAVVIESAGPHPDAKTAKTAGKKRARRRVAGRTHRMPNWRPGVANGFASPNSQDSMAAIGGPFVSPAAW